MAKIISVEVLEHGYRVAYESGAVRTFQTAPKTVLEWIEAAAPTVEEVSTEMEVMEIQAAEELSQDAPVVLIGSTEEEEEEAPEEEELPPAPVVVPIGSTETEEPVVLVREAPSPLPQVGLLETAARTWEALLSIWDGTTAFLEVSWEYLLPVLLVLGGFLLMAGRVALKGAVLAYRGAVKAAPAIAWGLVQGVGLLAVLGLLGAKYGALLLRLAVKAASAGWELRKELVNEWKLEAA